MDKLLKNLKKLLNKDVTSFLNKYKIPLVSMLVVVLLACAGLIITYAFYQTVDTTPIIGGSTGKIADLEVRIMAEERDTNGNGLNSYALYPYIPKAGYKYNQAKSYCTNGSVINYDSTNYSADITAYGHDVCYLYFDSTAVLDLTLNVYAENVDSTGVGTGEYTKLETTALPSIGYEFNQTKSKCQNGSTVTYNNAENMFTVEAREKDTCDAYMDAMDVDIALKIYVQAKKGSSLYYEANQIPTNEFYTLGSKSACTGTSTLSIQNQRVVIAATGKTNCVAYLDVGSGPILEAMEMKVVNQDVTIGLKNSNVGTTPSTYYYSKDGGASYVSSPNSSYTFNGASSEPATNFKAYSVDATGNTSRTVAFEENSNYVLNKAFPYSSTVQAFDISVTGYYKLQVWGAQGGSYNQTEAPGGKGGYSYGNIHLNAGDKLYVHTGGQGSYGTTDGTNNVSGGGVNGGGHAGYRGGGGGGGTDIRINNDSLYARVIVAGGGGGSFYKSSTIKASGGAGGGNVGIDGNHHNASYAYYKGKGGTQTSGGAGGTAEEANYYGTAGTFGQGGRVGYRFASTSIYSNGAGGGGWYGGGGSGHYNGSSNTRYTGGGGGSGYIYTAGTASSYPEGCLLNDAYYLVNAATINGATAFESPTKTTETGHSGNGYAIITYIGNTVG